MDARSMLIGVEVTLDIDPSAEISDVELTIGHDHLSHQGTDIEVRYHSVAAEVPGAAPVGFVAGEPGQYQLAAAGASYYSIAQAEIARSALAIHTTPRHPARLLH